jgi:hypothetical protein
MQLSVLLQKKAVQAAWSCGLFGVHKAAMRAGQEATKRPESTVKVYPNIAEITAATSKLRWTEDPWQGKLDVIKHPTFMQEALDKHPDYAGDCDDFAAYWLAALRKGKLADVEKLYFAAALWEDGGHAVASYRDLDGSWWWAGNWNRCVPLPTTEYGWIDGIKSRINKPLWVAGRIKVTGLLGDDTVVYGPASRCA